MTRTEKFISRFTYDIGPKFIDGWRFIDKDAIGDCDDFAITVAYHESGNWLTFMWDLLIFKNVFWLVKSPTNKILPRHIALYRRGKGWIDSTRREWRPTSHPHKKAAPMVQPWVVFRMLMGSIYKLFSKS